MFAVFCPQFSKLVVCVCERALCAIAGRSTSWRRGLVHGKQLFYLACPDAGAAKQQATCWFVLSRFNSHAFTACIIFSLAAYVLPSAVVVVTLFGGSRTCLRPPPPQILLRARINHIVYGSY